MTSITGQFFTGESSKSHEATLMFDGSQYLKVIYRDGEVSDKVGRLNISSRLGNIPRYIKFSNGGKFVTADNVAVDNLLKQAGLKPKGGLLHKLESHSLFVVLSLFLLVATFFYSITVVIPRFADETAQIAPPELAQMISESAIEAFDETWFEETEIEEGLQANLKEEFAFIAEPYADEFNFQLHFRKSSIIGANAFALPSGDIFITDDLLKVADNKDEILAVLAHEIGHVVHRHGLRRLFEDSLIAVLIFGVTGDTTMFAQAATLLPVLLVSRHYSRDYEREADEFAHQLMTENNISYQHFANILERLDEAYKEHRGVSTFFSTHPETEERMMMFDEDMQ